MDIKSPRVLSIQSHVVHGYVGNNCAIFALQINGIEADFINTTQLSNHTAYPSWTGDKINSSQIADLYQGLKKNQFHLTYTHTLTGYVNDSDSLIEIANIVKDLRDINPNLKYLCDPVMGDAGKLYPLVPIEMISLYKEHLLPLATIVKLNQTEIEFLTGIKLRNDDDAFLAMDQIHQYGPSVVVISSMDIESDKNKIRVVASSDPVNGHGTIRYVMNVDRKKDWYTGTGDLFSALFLVWSEKLSIASALHHTVSALQNVLENSSQRNANVRFKEIDLIHSSVFLTNPKLLDQEPLIIKT